MYNRGNFTDIDPNENCPKLLFHVSVDSSKLIAINLKRLLLYLHELRPPKRYCVILDDKTLVLSLDYGNALDNSAFFELWSNFKQSLSVENLRVVHNAVYSTEVFGLLPYIIDIETLVFYQGLSDILLDVLCEELLDKALLFTLSIYLHAGWFKARLDFDGEDVFAVLDHGYAFSSGSLAGMLDSDTYYRIVANEGLAMDIFHAVENQQFDHEDGLPEWMKKWSNESKMQLCHISTLFQSMGYMRQILFYLIPGMINRQLGGMRELMIATSYYLDKFYTGSENKRIVRI